MHKQIRPVETLLIKMPQIPLQNIKVFLTQFEDFGCRWLLTLQIFELENAAKLVARYIEKTHQLNHKKRHVFFCLK